MSPQILRFQGNASGTCEVGNAEDDARQGIRVERLLIMNCSGVHDGLLNCSASWTVPAVAVRAIHSTEHVVNSRLHAYVHVR